MTDESTEKPQLPGPPVAGTSYQVGDIGAGAPVAIGKNITWSEGLARYPGGDQLTHQLIALLEQIRRAQDLPEADRSLAQAKTQAVVDAEGNHASASRPV